MTRKLTSADVMTTSFRDYAESRGKSMSKYTPIGVEDSSRELIAENAPRGTEAVVDLRPTISSQVDTKRRLYGTALVPEKQKTR